MSNFSVQTALICDYATQDGGGKPILVGVQYGEIRFDETPKFFPPCFVHVVVIANDPKFSFYIKFLNSTDEEVFTVTSNFDAKNNVIFDQRIVVNVQIPPTKFTSEGRHSLVILDESNNEIYRQSYDIYCSPGVQVTAELSGSVNYNPKFRRSKGA